MNNPPSHFDNIVAYGIDESSLEKPSYEDQETYFARREQERDQALIDNLTMARITDHISSDEYPDIRAIRFINSPRRGIGAHLDCYKPANTKSGETYHPLLVEIGKYNTAKELVPTARFDASDLEILVDYFDNLEQDQLDGLLPDLQSEHGYYSIKKPHVGDMHPAKEQATPGTSSDE